MTESAPPSRSPTVATLRTEATFGLTELRSPAGLLVQITPSGAIYAIRHLRTLINQFIPGPAEDGLCRLLVRWRAPDGKAGWAPLIGPSVFHRQLDPTAVQWESETESRIQCLACLTLHRDLMAWSWRVLLKNTTPKPLKVDVLFAQDLGLADEAAVRNNEAFTSQYIDLLPIMDEHLGWTVLARQNQEAEGGRHPWIAVGCDKGAVAYCTDGTQFFGDDHRLAGMPAAVRVANLPSQRLQGEFAMAGLQSRPASLYSGGSTEIDFLVRYIPDHPAASSRGDLARLWETTPANWSAMTPALPPGRDSPHPSLFVGSPWAHGDRPKPEDWARWFPGATRQEERDPSGRLLSLFHGEDCHVVARDKEATVARPHGHIIRSGTWRWIDNEQFGTTCYAAGIFGAQTYLGNPTFGRLLPVVRNALGLGRAAGQRVFIQRDGEWHQLGIPSFFVMTPSETRWIYLFGSASIEARVWCSQSGPAAFLELRTAPGQPEVEFLVTHTLSLGANEFESPATLRFDHGDCSVECEPDPAGMVGKHFPGARYGVAAAEAAPDTRMGGDEMAFADGTSRGHPCICVRSGAAARFGVVLCGSNEGTLALRQVLDLARAEWSKGVEPSSPPPTPVRLSGGPGSLGAVSRLNEVLPWLNHNAAIHFSSPHGLEQQGGAAWGVRDVCQGSVEWLLTSCDWPLIRRILVNVFAQQYSRDGTWPQWFMHPPYQSVQQAHSHGDVCFWPIKALCDYVEASNDLAFLATTAGYTDPEGFHPAGPEESLLRHCDRVIDHCESRFIEGTALINFGDGDWDDTLQPADPKVRTRMVSSWTVALVYQAFRQLMEVCRRAGDPQRADRLEALLERMRSDFAARLMPGSIVAGFLVTDPGGGTRPLLHPSDTVTGIRYRLLPMTRSILAELFSPEEAATHKTVIERALVYPDGARLMSEPAAYRGGCEHLFKRADTAANVGREIGLQYVHAHLRYAEAMAKLGDAERLWAALQVANPVGLREVLANAMPRQSNVYFSSSDADFKDRIEAARRWSELRTGSVGVRGGWRLYSSGPGLYLHAVRASLLGLRESFGEIIFDPVLPKSLDGLSAVVTLCGRRIELRYRVHSASFAPRAVTVNGTELSGGHREANPYREGGLCFKEDSLAALLTPGDNTIVILI